MRLGRHAEGSGHRARGLRVYTHPISIFAEPFGDSAAVNQCALPAGLGAESPGGPAAEGRRRPPRPACLCNPARTCAPRARRSLLPPPASQCLALLCLPILRHSPWLASPPPSWDELQVCVPCARPCVCARCGERAPPPPAGQAFAGRYPARAPRASLAPRMSRSRPRFHRPHWAGG